MFKFLIKKYENKKPDLIIGEDYLHRWYLIPRNPIFNIYLHRFLSSDDDRALHDHPWVSLSYCIDGEMIEVSMDELKDINAGQWVFRRSVFAHRIIIRNPCWTIFVTGPKIRQWGFYCHSGWVHWSKMTTKDGKKIGDCGDLENIQ
jgi:hypothetical protein